MSEDKYTVLLVDDKPDGPDGPEDTYNKAIQQNNGEIEYNPLLVVRDEIGFDRLNLTNVNLVLLDYHLENSSTSLPILVKLQKENDRRLRSFNSEKEQNRIGILLYSGFRDEYNLQDWKKELHVWHKKGVLDFISKLDPPALLKFKMDKALKYIQFEDNYIKIKGQTPQEVVAHQAALYSKVQETDFVFKSPQMVQIFKEIEKIAPTDYSVLITGKSGVGKEIVARLLHEKSQRKGKTFFAFNCAALVSTLSQAELFGHEKGAYTGAVKERISYFEQADGGTIFLDEIGDMPMDQQALLLRVLQEKYVLRVGSLNPRPVNVRIISATNRNLKDDIINNKNSSFRDDLYYRISPLEIRIPPLCERKEDIIPLCENFIEKISTELEKSTPVISKEAQKCLLTYQWIGNVRELQNAMTETLVLIENECREIQLDHLPSYIRDRNNHGAATSSSYGVSSKFSPTHGLDETIISLGAKVSIEDFFKQLLEDIQKNDQTFNPSNIASQLFNIHLNSLPEDEKDRNFLRENYPELLGKKNQLKQEWNDLYKNYKDNMKKMLSKLENEIDDGDKGILILAEIKKLLKNKDIQVKKIWHLAFPMGLERKTLSNKINKFETKHQTKYSGNIKSFLMPDKKKHI